MRGGVKLLLFAALAAFGVLYAMELTASGISRVYGPLDEGDRALYRQTGRMPEQAERSARAPEPDYYAREPAGIAVGEEAGAAEAEALPDVPIGEHRPIVDRLAGQTAKALYELSRTGIRAVVSVFGSLGS